MTLFEQKMLFKDGKNKAFTLSFDDGVEEDLKLIELLKKYNMKCTFNLSSGLMPSKTISKDDKRVYIRLEKDDIKKVYDDFEISTHSVKHMVLDDNISTDRIMYEIINDRYELEKISGRIIRGFAYPYGVYNDRLIKILRDANIAYSRTVNSTYDFSIPKDLLLWNPTTHQADEKLGELTEKFLNYKDEENPALFYVWGHAYEFNCDKEWNRIEEFFKKMSNKDDVWYATNIEIANYIEAYKSLIYSVDGSMVYNPSSQSVWIKTDGYVVEIKPNCQEKLKHNVFA